MPSPRGGGAAAALALVRTARRRPRHRRHSRRRSPPRLPPTQVLFAPLTSAYYLPGTYPREWRTGEDLQGARRPSYWKPNRRRCRRRRRVLGPATSRASAGKLRQLLRRQTRHTPLPSPSSLLAAEVNSLVSSETEIPFDHYSLPFCAPPGGAQKVAGAANPGTLLAGARVRSSPYEFKMMVEQRAQPACRGEEHPGGAAPPLTKESARALRDKIKNGYRARFILDNLPITTVDLEAGPEAVRPGVEVGRRAGVNEYYVNNHCEFSRVLGRPVEAENTLGTNQPTNH